MRKRSRLVVAIVVIAIASTVGIYASTRGGAARVSSPPPDSVKRALIAGPGRVEPSSEEIKLASELSGTLRSVNVEEGDTITRGQVLAVLENDDYAARVTSAEAEVTAKAAMLRKVLNGARSQERSEALASVRAAQALMEHARAEMERRQKLYVANLISREESERYARDHDVAKAKYQKAVERHSLLDEEAREEDRSFAEADLNLARGRLHEARARYAKTLIQSPIDGMVLRKHHRSGESVSNGSTLPDPILTVGNTKILRVRVDVDETDVSKVRVGQQAYVTADAFGGQKFRGRVIRIGKELGRKNIRTDEPTERVDTKVLEVLVELDPGVQMPIGLRVDAFIVTNARCLTVSERTPPADPNCG